MRILFITFLFFLMSSHIYSQKNLAIVKDADGVSNIRAKGNIDSEIVQEISTGSLIYVDEGDSKWHRCFIDDTLIGFIHSSRFCIFKSLDEGEKCQKIVEVFKRQIELDSLLNLSRLPNDSLVQLHDVYTTKMFHPITLEATQYICAKNDLEVFMLFQKVMWENRGSAAEEPKYNFGELVYCLNEEMVLNLKENWSKDICLLWKGFFDQVLGESNDIGADEKLRLQILVNNLGA